jgi:glycosyltransferase involved in cell wall biosynthesis
VAGSGSTGKIAAEKCAELQNSGHRCVLAYGRWKSNCENIETHRIGTKFDVIFHGILSRIFDLHGFGSVRATKKFLRWVDSYNPDVIWLHNVHGYYINVEILFDYLKKSGKKIFWTLHDCWSFTGHCSYFTFAKCEKWKVGCSRCPQKKRYPGSFLFDNSRKNFVRKKNAFTGVPDLTIITPSVWLSELVKQSFLSEYSVQAVKNSVDTNRFKNSPGDFRRRYGLLDKRMILGVASVWEERKGLDDFIKLSEMLDENYRIVLVGLSKKQIAKIPRKILALPRTENSAQLAEIYSAADVFVNLSYEENFPTVNLEAQACGTKVVCYDSGGTKETLNEKNRNNLAQPGNLEKIKEIICSGFST